MYWVSVLLVQWHKARAKLPLRIVPSRRLSDDVNQTPRSACDGNLLQNWISGLAAPDRQTARLPLSRCVVGNPGKDKQRVLGQIVTLKLLYLLPRR